MNPETVFDGSTDERSLALLRRATDACVAHSGDWYTSEHVEIFFGAFVGCPALSLDAAFISLATPERVQALLIEIDTLRRMGSAGTSAAAVSS